MEYNWLLFNYVNGSEIRKKMQLTSWKSFNKL